MIKRMLTVFVAATLMVSSAQVAEAKPKTEHAGSVYFASGKSELTSASKSAIRAIAKKIKSGDVLIVNGFVQLGISAKNNKSLALSRAKSVRNFFRKLGVQVKIVVAGRGLPKSKKKSSKARRVDISITRSGSKPTPSPTPTPTPDVLRSVSGVITVDASNATHDCTHSSLSSLSLRQSGESVQALEGPLTWSSTTNGTCVYNYTFDDVSPGTYQIEANYQCTSPIVCSDARNDAVNTYDPSSLGGWSVITENSTIYSAHSSDVVVDGASNITGINHSIYFDPITFTVSGRVVINTTSNCGNFQVQNNSNLSDSTMQIPVATGQTLVAGQSCRISWSKTGVPYGLAISPFIKIFCMGGQDCSGLSVVTSGWTKPSVLTQWKYTNFATVTEGISNVDFVLNDVNNPYSPPVFNVNGEFKIDQEYSAECSSAGVDSLSLWQGGTQVQNISALTWTSTVNGVCVLNYIFEDVANGNYTVHIQGHAVDPTPQGSDGNYGVNSDWGSWYADPSASSFWNDIDLYRDIVVDGADLSIFAHLVASMT